MKKLFPEYFSIEKRVLLMVVLSYIIADHIFLFSLPVKKEPHRPMMVFRGSFFDSFEHNKTRKEKIDTSEIRDLELLYQPAAPSIIAFEKPGADSRSYAKSTKEELKTSFLKESGLNKKTPPDNRAVYEATKATYIPLSAQSHILP